MEKVRKNTIEMKKVAAMAIIKGRELKASEITKLEDVPVDIVANILAMGFDMAINDNVFGLYIAEKKVKRGN